ncbi:MAG: Ig-like domain-containing protein, partial [Paramuribaculum sp.]|nr:Ig-like domain-containing protein [Paramuribaculum sp.]
MKNQNLTYLRWPLLAILTVIAAACASMGRPEGGPIDEDPPVFIKSNPAPGQLNVSSDRIIIEFNENIQVDDPLNKVVISPAQKTPAKVTGVGHRVTVMLQDSLRENTTYTLDFTAAIKDLNEGNQIDGFALDFSTGPTLDTLSISGMVFAAENLEPAQSMLVGVHSNLADSALTTLPFDRITRTNQLGQFTIRNLKPGDYHIFAINDVNRDNKWDRSEDIAFYPVTISPTASRAQVSDTLKTADGSADSIVMREVTVFAPNDILLTWFNENYKSQYMSKNERRQRHIINLEMGAASDTLPSMRFVGGPFDGEDFGLRSVLEASATRDTLTYWIADSAVIALDTLYVAATYLRTDTLDQLSWTTDTLNFSLRPQKKKDNKKEDGKKKEEKSDSTATAPKIDLLNIKSSIG